MSLLVVLCSTAIAGGSERAFLIAAGMVVAVRWSAGLWRPRARRRYLILDPETPDAKNLMTAFRAVVEEVAHSKRTVILRIAAFTADPRFRPCLSLTAEGDMTLIGCARKQALQHPGVWLADHPLPFGIPLAHSLTLVFSPCAGERVRVAEDIPPALHPYIWYGVILLIVFACCFNLNTLLAAALAFTGETHLIRRQ